MRSVCTSPSAAVNSLMRKFRPALGVVGLAVVAKRARELEQLGVAGDEHAALAGRDRLRRVERVDPGVAERARAAAVPDGAVRVRAVLDQDDAALAAERGDRLEVERDVPADVHEDHRRGVVLVDQPLELGERQAEVVAAAVDEDRRRAGAEHGERRRHERVRRARRPCARAPAPTRARPARRRSSPTARRRAAPFVRRPRRLEAGRQLALAPALAVDDAVPQLVQARAVALVEADREAVEAPARGRVSVCPVGERRLEHGAPCRRRRRAAPMPAPGEAEHQQLHVQPREVHRLARAGRDEQRRAGERRDPDGDARRRRRVETLAVSPSAATTSTVCQLSFESPAACRMTT